MTLFFVSCRLFVERFIRMEIMDEGDGRLRLELGIFWNELAAFCR